ncbi:hypothetical protein SAMN02745723_10655 [Pragia fontium DSM 5563 = ATCC 49100]|uniref:Uncharacterized protein n=1 Tax=Pragia fontium DSM 5563 = ATCC 49100 TaxID=1122977 RepID=A0AAJ4WB64_9GAMM|nr:hypothetical protein SAMN02745723_10655 [Pragia fontium DSM 5563 = ATCC 49100]
MPVVHKKTRISDAGFLSLELRKPKAYLIYLYKRLLLITEQQRLQLLDRVGCLEWYILLSDLQPEF